MLLFVWLIGVWVPATETMPVKKEGSGSGWAVERPLDDSLHARYMKNDTICQLRGHAKEAKKEEEILKLLKKLESRYKIMLPLLLSRFFHSLEEKGKEVGKR